MTKTERERERERERAHEERAHAHERERESVCVCECECVLVNGVVWEWKLRFQREGVERGWDRKTWTRHTEEESISSQLVWLAKYNLATP